MNPWRCLAELEAAATHRGDVCPQCGAPEPAPTRPPPASCRRSPNQCRRLAASMTHATFLNLPKSNAMIVPKSVQSSCGKET